MDGFFFFLRQGEVLVHVFICSHVYFLSSEFVVIRKWILNLSLDISLVVFLLN